MEDAYFIRNPESLRISQSKNSSAIFFISDSAGLSCIISPKQKQFSVLPEMICINKKMENKPNTANVIFFTKEKSIFVMSKIPNINSPLITKRAIIDENGRPNSCKLKM